MDATTLLITVYCLIDEWLAGRRLRQRGPPTPYGVPVALSVLKLPAGALTAITGLVLLFEAEATNLFFQLVSARYERATLIVTSNKPLGRWGEVFGDDVVAAAMIDRLVHHAEVVSLKGDSYRLKNRDLGRVPTATTEEHDQQGGQFSAAVDTPPRLGVGDRLGARAAAARR